MVAANSAELGELVGKVAGFIMKGDITREKYEETAGRIVALCLNLDAQTVLDTVNSIEAK